MTGYAEKTENLKQNLKPLIDEIRDREETLLEEYLHDEDYEGFPENAGIDIEERPKVAKGMYRDSIDGRAQRDETERNEEYIFPVDGLLEEVVEDLELAVKQLEKASKRIDTLEQIHDDLEDVNYIMYEEIMYIDFVWTIRHILDEIVENFRTGGEEEIGEYEPFGEGGFEINVIKENEALEKERSYVDGEMNREEVDWSIDTENAERGDFNELREEHFEGLKSITFEIKQCRNELDSALLITARRIGTAIDDLNEAEEYLEKAEAEDLLQNCRETREGLEQIRKTIERETLEPMDDGLRRSETFIQDLIEGNSDEIERILNGGNWYTKTDDGMISMGWDKPDIYEDEEDSEA